MALEDLTGSSKFIDDLVATNPVGASDEKGKGDDHIRGVKNVIQNTFPNVDAAVTPTPAELNSLAGRASFIDDLLQAANAAAALVVLGAEAAFASGTKLLFPQTSAPTGWTIVASDDDTVIMNSSTAGGGTGGSWTISGISVDGKALTTSMLPFGMRWLSTGASVNFTDSGVSFYSYPNAQYQNGAGATHDHDLTIGNSWRPAYLEVITCTKD